MAEPVYEMLWDCAYCGTRKLLGKTHRFCPKCGAPQAAEKRYFPSEDEKVAVEDHVYVGADRVCAACGSAMSAKALHCSQCGAPLEGTREVRRVDAEPAPAPTPARGKRSRLLPAIGAALLLLVGGLLVTLFWKKGAQAQVAEAKWERSVAVETLLPVRESNWCDSLPRAAYGVSRHREVRSHRQIQVGEECRNVNVDRGDGTFAQRRECTPRYRQEPVYADRCDYTVDRWTQARRAVASGTALGLAPHWPALALRAGECRGCEREGARRTTYKVVLQSGGRRFECEVPEQRWAELKPGTNWAFKLGVVTGAPDCGSLRPAPGS